MHYNRYDLNNSNKSININSIRFFIKKYHGMGRLSEITEGWVVVCVQTKFTKLNYSGGYMYQPQWVNR